MSGSDLVFNNVKGEVKTLFGLPAAADAIIVVPVEATGLEADSTLKDYDDLSTLLAGSSNEQTTAGRKTISASITITVDDTNDRLDIDVPDQTWTALTGNAIGALLWCYDNDTGAGTDANIRPMLKSSFDITPDGSDTTAQIAAAGLFRAA